jgi:ferredoxin-like protein FixX
VDDLTQWLHDLTGCPTVNRTLTAACPAASHDDEPATWFYVEADRAEGVARLRCLACGLARPLLDSEERWTFPPAWSCGNCRQSIAEVGYGLHLEDDDTVSWFAMGVRCVNCGELAGVADFVLGGTSVDEVAASL